MIYDLVMLVHVSSIVDLNFVSIFVMNLKKFAYGVVDLSLWLMNCGQFCFHFYLTRCSFILMFKVMIFMKFDV